MWALDNSFVTYELNRSKSHSDNLWSQWRTVTNHARPVQKFSHKLYIYLLVTNYSFC